MGSHGGFNVGIVGATGLVGTNILALLEQRDFPVAELRALAGSSRGRTVEFRGERVAVQTASPDTLDDLDVAFFAAGGGVSRELAPEAAARGAVVIDNSSAFRLDADVPLIVPEVNGDELGSHRGIIANPNCSTIQLVMALKPLHELAELQRVIVTTYQAVSGTGVAGLAALEREAAERAPDGGGDGAESGAGARGSGGADGGPYPHPIAYNVIPQCDVFDDDGYTLEEKKVVHETRKILGLPHLPVTATAVRVPVEVGHSEAVLLEFSRPVDPAEAREALMAAPGVKVVDDPGGAGYPTPLEAAGADDVLVGRIRPDISSPKGLWIWVVSDNLRKGAALNAVQIGEALAVGGFLTAGAAKAEI